MKRLATSLFIALAAIPAIAAAQSGDQCRAQCAAALAPAEFRSTTASEQQVAFRRAVCESTYRNFFSEESGGGSGGFSLFEVLEFSADGNGTVRRGEVNVRDFCSDEDYEASSSFMNHFWMRAAPTPEALQAWTQCVTNGCNGGPQPVRVENITDTSHGFTIRTRWDRDFGDPQPRITSVEGDGVSCTRPADRRISVAGTGIACRWETGISSAVLIRTSRGDVIVPVVRPASASVAVLRSTFSTETRPVCGATVSTPDLHEARCDGSDRFQGGACTICEGQHRFCYQQREFEVRPSAGWRLVAGTARFVIVRDHNGSARFNCADRFPGSGCAGFEGMRFEESPDRFFYSRSFQSHSIDLQLCGTESREVEGATLQRSVMFRVWPGDRFAVRDGRGRTALQLLDTTGMTVEELTNGESGAHLTRVSGGSGAHNYEYR